MFVQCPSCHQNNPENAKQCLHCDHQLPTNQSEDFKLDLMGSSGDISKVSFAKNPKFMVVLAILVVLLAAGAVMMFKNARPATCFDEGDTARIAQLEAQGYECEEHEDIFSNKASRSRRRGRNSRTEYQVCCSAPREEE